MGERPATETRMQAVKIHRALRDFRDAAMIVSDDQCIFSSSWQVSLANPPYGPTSLAGELEGMMSV
jgi:hypothetical protein